jgi:DNA-binding NarL/FixJ family response regulator
MGSATALADVSDVIVAVNPLIVLAERADEPMVATSFFTRIAEVQSIRSRYDEALALASKGLTVASNLHLDFAVGYCLVMRIGAEIGLRRFEAARRSLKTLAEIVYSREDPYLEIEHQVLHMRMKLANRRHRFTETVFREQVWENASGAVKSEYLSVKSFLATVNGHPDEALRLAEQARRLSDGADARFNSQFSIAIAERAQGKNEKSFQNVVISLTLECADSDVLDSLVLAARADHRVPAAARANPAAKAIFRDTLVRSQDEAIARPAGLIDEQMEDVIVAGPHRALTPRELEVLQLLSRGLSNSAIAEELVIAESTVKVHVRHILKKLNVDTRLQAALKSARGNLYDPL